MLAHAWVALRYSSASARGEVLPPPDRDEPRGENARSGEPGRALERSLFRDGGERRELA